MYSNKLVCSVKVGRKILREKVQNNESAVFIPFGSEYSLLLKNLGGQNAVTHIEIDGRKVSQNGFYIKAGQTADIERFVENLIEGRRFKFIEKTEEISDFRGDKVDDGMIRVTWQFEKPLPEVKEIYYDYKHEHDHYHRFHPWGCRCPICYPYYWYGPITYGRNTIPLQNITYTKCADNITLTNSGGGTQSSSCFSSSIGQANNLLRNADLAPGITVEGSKSNQQFGTAYARELESNVHSIIIILKGYHGKNNPVVEPVLVHEKLQCPTCGKKWNTNFEFCANCGTALR